MPKSIFHVIRQSRAGYTHLGEERTTCPGVTSVSPLTPASPPEPPPRRGPLPGAGPAAAAQPSPRASAAASPVLPALPSSPCRDVAGVSGSRIQEETRAASNPQLPPSSVSLFTERIWLSPVPHSLLAFAPCRDQGLLSPPRTDRAAAAPPAPLLLLAALAPLVAPGSATAAVLGNSLLAALCHSCSGEPECHSPRRWF